MTSLVIASIIAGLILGLIGIWIQLHS